MKAKVLILALSMVFVLSLVIGCAKAPQQQIDTARAALDAARNVEADRYVADQFNAAKSALDGAMAEVEKQNSKFLFKSYKDAEGLLSNATNLANEAERAAVARKEEIKNQMPALIQQLESAIVQVKALLKKAPRAKEGLAAIQSIQSDVVRLENTVIEANNAAQQDDYMTAFDTAKAGLDKANALISELNQAISKKSFLSSGY